MDNFITKNVRVFPSAYRTQIPEGKFNSEKNFTGLIRAVVDKPSYAISYDGGILKVVLYGYYFEIEMGKPAGDYWVALKLENVAASTSGEIHVDHNLVNYDTTGISPVKKELDDGTYFKGIVGSNSEISSKIASDYNVYSLQVFKAGTLCNVQKFNTDSVAYNSSTTLTEELNAKQYKLEAGSGITIGGTKSNKISSSHFNRTNSLTSKGSAIKHVYFDNKGEAKESNATIGSRGAIDGSLIIDENVYIVGGNLTAGYTVYASTNTPSTTSGTKGDIWLQYVNN